MSKQKIALAYCIDNIKIAEEIDNRISASSPYHFEHFYCKKNTTDVSLSEQLRSFGGPVLLIVSDNFLKSAQCMNKSLALLQTQGSQILPVVADGMAKDEQSGKSIPIPTNFERVSDIIQYINYWQDQYLDLRRQKRQIKGLDEEKFNAHLKVMREISSEAGEFLRLLRNLDYVYFADLADNHFHRFFEFVDDLPTWERFRQTDRGATQPSPAETETEEPPVDLSEIPGIHLLPDAAGEEEETEPIRGESPLAEGEEDISITAGEEDTSHVQDDKPEHSEEEVEEDDEDEDEDEDEEEEDIDDLIRQAAGHINSGDWEQGVSILGRVVSSYPDNTQVRYHYALALAQRRERLGNAAEQLQYLLAMEPANTAALFLMGELAELQSDYETAREYYQRVAAQSPNHPDIYYRLGVVVANHFPEDAEQAGRYLQQAAERNPDNIDALYQYAMLLSDTLNQPGEAMRYFSLVLERQPGHPFVNYDLAVLHHRLGRQDDARAYYLNAIAVNAELQTEENDLAFGIHPTPEPSPAPEASPEETPPVEEAAEETPHQEAPVIAEEAAAEEEEYDEGEITREEFLEEPQPLSPPLSVEGGAAEEAAPQPEKEEGDPLEALKRNIRRLEEMLKARESATAPERPKRAGEGRIVMITGATSGIGRATAKEFAENGYRLILTGRRQERLDRLKQIFEELYQAEVKTLCFDVRDIHAIERVFQEQLDFDWRQIDILVNNAGKAKGLDPIHRGRLEHWEEMIDTNIKGLLYMTRAVVQYMIKRRNGHIINVASTAGKEVYQKGNVYCATKFAVDALTKAMRIDLLKYNIRVSQVAPGHVEHTEFAEVRFDGDEERAQIYDDFVPLNARDVAETIYFMASRPRHVNILDIVMTGAQQAGATDVDRRGRELVDTFIDHINSNG